MYLDHCSPSTTIRHSTLTSTWLPVIRSPVLPVPARTKVKSAGTAAAARREADQQAAKTTTPIKRGDLLGKSLAYAVKRAQIRCDEALVRHLGGSLSPARFAALCAIGANPGISQALLGGLLGIKGPGTVKVVDELERMGLVSRNATEDRRAYALQLTLQGNADLDRYEAANQFFEERIAARLSARERTLLLTLLAKVADGED